MQNIGIHMPTYESVCLQCGKYHEYIRPMSQSDDSPYCCDKQTSKRILSVPMAQFDVEPWNAFESPATGKMITSKAERKEDMKVSGCRDWEGMEAERHESDKIKREEEVKLDQALEHTVRTAWANLSPSKKAMALREA